MQSNRNLSHLNSKGDVHMVDVGDRPSTFREAHAQGSIQMDRETLDLILRGDTPKGDVLAVARIAAIQAAKRTWELIPLCHPISLSGMDVDTPPVTVVILSRTLRQTSARSSRQTTDRGGLSQGQFPTL